MVGHKQIGKGYADDVHWDTNYNKWDSNPKCDDNIAVTWYIPYVVKQFAFYFMSFKT